MSHCGNSPPQKQRAKEIIHNTQCTFEKLKQDLQDKEIEIEEKNREILRLRMHAEEAAMEFGGRRKKQTEVVGCLDPQQRGDLV